MSDTANSASEDSELRAGHPPALRVGNMRVARNRTTSDNVKEDGEAHDPAPVDPSTGAYVPHNAQRQVAAQNEAGQIAKESPQLAVQSVKAFHEKPQPTREKPSNNVSSQKRIIQQPK